MPYTASQRLTLAIVPRLAALLIRVLGATLRYEDIYTAKDGTPGTTRGDIIPGPTVFAFWHRSLLTCAHRFRDKDIAILISRSFDGELIARTVERLGFKAVRCAFTADGPRGPAMVAQPGPVQLAQLVQAPWVGAFYALPLSAWQLNSWDRFLIPKPFSRVVFTWPPHIPASQLTLAAVQAALDQAVLLTTDH